jgi:outer membrane receptor for ferric coprogen and ferric-rhodotorulic acid
MKDLDWQTLSHSSATFFSSLEHLNDDNWVQQRLNLAEANLELNNKYTALISLVSKNVEDLLKKDHTFQNLNEVRELIKVMQSETKTNVTTVNGWIGVQTVHELTSTPSSEEMKSLSSLILLFQN